MASDQVSKLQTGPGTGLATGVPGKAGDCKRRERLEGLHEEAVVLGVGQVLEDRDRFLTKPQDAEADQSAEEPTRHRCDFRDVFAAEAPRMGRSSPRIAHHRCETDGDRAGNQGWRARG
ncbi:MAG: hypothetical protein IPK13_19095 [Deltaproteobacteria bacterium]|nr:hypothetical protein [Deltaproteobacteria bacterium]